MKKGEKMSDEQKEKIRISNLGQKRSEETKRKISLIKLGKPSPKKGRSDITRDCLNCKKIFTYVRWENKKCCSYDCAMFALGTIKKPIPVKYCELCGKQIPMVNKNYTYFLRKRFCAPHCRQTYNAQIRKGVPVSGYGERHWNWQGGKGKERHKLMSQNEYKNWRDEVFVRDNYTCRICNATGIKLHVDHIKSWANYPSLRYDINNGRTLCYKCHYEITFGKPIPHGIKWG